MLSRWLHLEDIPADPADWDVTVRSAAKLAATLREQFELALLFRRIATVVPAAPVSASVDEHALDRPGRSRPRSPSSAARSTPPAGLRSAPGRRRELAGPQPATR